MEPVALAAIEQLDDDIINSLEPKRLLGFLFQAEVLEEEEYEDILEWQCSQDFQTRHFLIRVVSRCPLSVFLEALWHDGTYGFLAEPLSALVESLMHQHHSQHAHAFPKVRVATEERRRQLTLATRLKALSGSGHWREFDLEVERVDREWRAALADPTLTRDQRAEVATLKLTVLDALADKARVVYDTGLQGGDILKEMQELIPSTSSPQLSTVAFLTRYRAAIGMTAAPWEALSFQQDLESQADRLGACRENGVMYYSKANLLLQCYEASPCPELKEEFIEAARRSDFHYSHEDSFTEEQRDDQRRQVLLKLVFVHLGMGVFGQEMPHCHVTEADLTAARDILGRIQALQGGLAVLSKRRRMFYVLADTRLQLLEGKHKMAAKRAREARRLAREGGYQKELGHIQQLLQNLRVTPRKAPVIRDVEDTDADGAVMEDT